jgi:N-acetylneuraminate lyase
MALTIQGILPAVLTPFTAEGTPDLAALRGLIARLYDAEVDGLYVCGQTGEGLVQSVAMRQAVLETALECSPAGKTVIAHVGAARMEDALALSAHAARAGAHAVSSLPPMGQYGVEEIRSYYATLAAASRVPLVLYYFPEAAPALRAEQVAELCALPNVAGVKFTSFELHRIAELNRAGAFVLNGRDEVLAAGLLMGACGGIGSFYNLVPELFVALRRAQQRGAWHDARQLQDRINDLISLVLRFPMIPAIKKILEWSGLPCGGALAPRRGLTEAEEVRLRAELEAAQFDPCGFLAEPSGARP